MGVQTHKNLSVETLRGIAILLVVVGHVIGSAPDGGMKIDYPSAWRYIYLFIDYIQMPLFTAIAGWVYAIKPVSKSTLFGGFAMTKVRRLLIPMASVSTIYFLVQYIVPGTNNKEALESIWRIYLFPYTIFWYLQALFLIFIAVFLLDRSGVMATVRSWAVTTVASVALYVAAITVIPWEVPNVFCFKGAINQLPYFLAGVGIYRYGAEIYAHFKTTLIILAVIGLGLLQVRWFYPGIFPELYQCLLPLWLIPLLFIAFKITRPNKLFVYLGAYAYAIYLFHGFGTSGGRIILSYFGIYDQIVVFSVSLAIALVLPIVAQKIFSTNRFTGTMFLGQPFNNRKS